MTDTFWPVYQSLEMETLTVLSYIHCTDDQLQTYSIKNAELITRAAIEIEALSKKLYAKYGGPPKNGFLRYDDDCIAHLEGRWSLSAKAVLLTSTATQLRSLKSQPFKKIPIQRNGKTRSTFVWNDAYQALKHDREQSLSKATLHSLIEGMKALYMLNLYNRSESVILHSHETDADADASFGSRLFAIRIHPHGPLGSTGRYTFEPYFDECVYLSRPKEPQAIVARRAADSLRNGGPRMIGPIERLRHELVTNRHQNYLCKNPGGSSMGFEALLALSLNKALSQLDPKHPLDSATYRTIAIEVEQDVTSSLPQGINPDFGLGDTMKSQVGVYLVEMGLADETVEQEVTTEIGSAI